MGGADPCTETRHAFQLAASIVAMLCNPADTSVSWVAIALAGDHGRAAAGLSAQPSAGGSSL